MTIECYCFIYLMPFIAFRGPVYALVFLYWKLNCVSKFDVYKIGSLGRLTNESYTLILLVKITLLKHRFVKKNKNSMQILLQKGSNQANSSTHIYIQRTISFSLE